jgi:hypothetical protein
MTVTRSESLDRAALGEQVQDCLDQALVADDQELKNYHIRRALQYWVILTDPQ